MPTAEELLSALSRELRLEFETQDWGILNADASRLEEFISFFEHTPLEPTQRFQMGELIIASANARLVEGGHIPLASLLSLTRRHEDAFRFHVRYWTGLTSEEEFPVARVLRSALASLDS